LNGLNILITDTGKNPTIETLKSVNATCAVLISKRYNLFAEADTVTGSSEKSDILIDKTTGWTWKNYNDFASKTINEKEAIYGIYIDPHTAGRTKDTRVKIRNNVIYIVGKQGDDYSAKCFFGSVADLSDNTFTTAGVKGVLDIYCIFGFNPDVFSFTRNIFNAPANGRLALVTVNAWHNITGNGTNGYDGLKKQIKHDATPIQDFGGTNAEFKTLPAGYQKLVKDLFAQAPITDSRYVTLWDVSYSVNNGNFSSTNNKTENYEKKGDDYTRWTPPSVPPAP